MIEFRLDGASGVTTYLQLVHQVRGAIRLGRLRPGDQLPTVRDVVARLAINPNTVLKAYRELELEGLVEGRPGAGTFVSSVSHPDSSIATDALRQRLSRWVQDAYDAGLEPASVRALIEDVIWQPRRLRAAGGQP